MSDELIAKALREAQVIAVVGLSPNEARPSWGVSRFLKSQGYRVIPVNPGHAGKLILDETTYGSLSQIPPDIPVDMVDIFRRSDSVPAIVDEAIAHLPHLKVIWTQLGVISEKGAQTAEKAGITMIQDRCPKIDIPRLGISRQTAAARRA